MSKTKSHEHGYAKDKEALVKRLHRIEGQVRGIERMVEDDRYCIDILTQIAAVNTALESLAFKVLDEHVNHCVADAMASGDPKAAAEKSQELLAAGLADGIFWWSIAVGFAIAFVPAVLVNRWLIARGKGHAVVHEYHHH